MDLQSLLGLGGQSNDPGGLLTPQQSGDINQTTMQGIAAGLLKASGPSPYKPGMTALSGLGDALQGGLAARRQAQSDALNQTLVRAKTLEGIAPLLKVQQEYAIAGLPLPENYRRVIDSLTGITTGRGAGVGAGAPGAPGAAPSPSASTNPQVQYAISRGYNPGIVLKDAPGHEAFITEFNDFAKATSEPLASQKQTDEVIKQDVEHYGNQYVGIQAARRAGEKILTLTDQAKAITDLMEKSGYHPGGTILPELQTAWRQFAANFGGDPNAAFAPEVFKKVTNEALLGIQQDAAATAAEIKGAAGRNLLATVKLQLGASPSTDITLPSNRYLQDQMATNATHSVNIGKEAANYKAANKFKRLDEGWDTREAELNAAHRAAQLKKLQTEGLAGLTPTPPAQAQGVQPIPGMMSPAGPGAGSGFLSIAPGAAPPPTQSGAAAAAPPAASRPIMQPGVVYPSHDGKSFIALINGKPTPVDAGGRPLGK